MMLTSSFGQDYLHVPRQRYVDEAIARLAIQGDGVLSRWQADPACLKIAAITQIRGENFRGCLLRLQDAPAYPKLWL